MEDITDAELMKMVKDGEERAFVTLIRRYQQLLLNFFYWLGADIYEAEDLIQETFLKLFRYRYKYRPYAEFKTFLYTLAYRSWVDTQRKQKRLIEVKECVSEKAEREEHLLRIEETEDVRMALTRLPDKLRSVLVLNIYQDMRYKEIAEVLGVPLGTVKSRIHLAVKQMRELLSVQTVCTEQKRR